MTNRTSEIAKSRADRRAEALRENLARRKEQARARAAVEPGADGGDAPAVDTGEPTAG